MKFMIFSTIFGFLCMQSVVGLAFESKVISLQKRQSATAGGLPPTAPTQCQSTCDPLESLLTGEDDKCQASVCCQASFETSYFNCFKCVAAAINITDLTAPQILVDELFDSCANAGFSLPKLTFDGQNPNRTLSSVVSRAASSTPAGSTPASSFTASSTSLSLLSSLSELSSGPVSSSTSLSLLSSLSELSSGPVSSSPPSTTSSNQTGPTSTNTSPGSNPLPTLGWAVRSLDTNQMRVGIVAMLLGTVLQQFM